MGSVLSCNGFGIWAYIFFATYKFCDKVDDFWIVIKITLNYTQIENFGYTISDPPGVFQHSEIKRPLFYQVYQIHIDMLYPYLTEILMKYALPWELLLLMSSCTSLYDLRISHNASGLKANIRVLLT